MSGHNTRAHWQAKLIVLAFVLAAAGIATMNIIRVIKTARKKTEPGRVQEEKLDAIPTSQLPGISALPAELWSQVLRGILDPHLQHKRRQCHGLPAILELRLVCRTSKKKILNMLNRGW